MPSGALELDNEDIEIRLQAREGWAAAQGAGCVVVLNTEVTDELRREGIAKDVIRSIQSQRKELDCEYTQRIEIGIVTEDAEVTKAIQEHQSFIANETLADNLVLGTIEGVDPVETDFGSLNVKKI